jgi:hypothetical protein
MVIMGQRDSFKWWSGNLFIRCCLISLKGVRQTAMGDAVGKTFW